MSRSKHIRRVLIANRGEIAVRIIRSLRELDITSIAVFSDPDRAALHVLMADEALPLGPGPSRESYLDPAKVIASAVAARADAIHPGYGFFAENEFFARECERAGVAFIGPRPETIAALGDKLAARAAARAAGVPLVPGSG
ncbi:MAG TPA: biotin carboxylase N-terminal domain-containing protein, partial [Candidatus Eisenbacteria bacterium]|nr:biotin carboxylase N-terminal domain-containing protein [Candidatus Eisenbacteria bacterium]